MRSLNFKDLARWMFNLKKSIRQYLSAYLLRSPHLSFPPQKLFYIVPTFQLIPVYKIVGLGPFFYLAPMNSSKVIFSIQYTPFSVWQYFSNKESSKVIIIKTILNWSYLAKPLRHLYQLYRKLNGTKSILQIMSLFGPRLSLNLVETNSLCDLLWSMPIEQQELIMFYHLYSLILVKKQERNQKRHLSSIIKPQYYIVLHKLSYLLKISCILKKLFQHCSIARSQTYITQLSQLPRERKRSKLLPKDPQENRPQYLSQRNMLT